MTITTARTTASVAARTTTGTSSETYDTSNSLPIAVSTTFVSAILLCKRRQKKFSHYTM